jgi:sugar lactone lactonase YvrE
MFQNVQSTAFALSTLAVVGLAACADEASTAPMARPAAAFANASSTNGSSFAPLASSVACTTGGNVSALFAIPAGFTQANIASEPDYLGNPDMITQNETGLEAGRFIYQTHELGLNSNTGVSVTDLLTGTTRMLMQRNDWGSLDGIAWTPWGTLLIAEERTGGKVWELNPSTLELNARPALGLKSHEGMRIDPQGNVYGISENNPGFIFRFTPDTRSDLSSGQLYALKITNPTGDRVGDAEWIPLSRTAVQVDANAAALAAGATGYNRPEDLEIGTSTGNNQGGNNVLYVALTGPSNPVDNRIIAIDLREPAGGSDHATAFVYDYVRWGVNAVQGDFEMPDNLALDRQGNLYITEDPATAPSTKRGDDIWVATPPKGPPHQAAESVVRFASLTDCSAEPTGIYFDLRSSTLFVHAQHRGGDGLDKTVAFTRE